MPENLTDWLTHPSTWGVALVIVAKRFIIGPKKAWPKDADGHSQVPRAHRRRPRGLVRAYRDRVAADRCLGALRQVWWVG